MATSTVGESACAPAGAPFDCRMNAATLTYSSWLNPPGRVGGIVSCMNDSSSRVVLRPQPPMNSVPASGAASPDPLRSGR